MKQLALALSGGGARGIAHVGVLAALDELQIPVARLAGVSSGAIVGALYAAGLPPRAILREIERASLFRLLLRPAFSWRGLLSTRGIAQELARLLGGPEVGFGQLAKPLTVVATDLLAGAAVAFTTGALLPPLLGTTAVPLLFRPVEHQGRLLVDGGVLNLLPVEPLLATAGPNEVVIAANSNPVGPRTAGQLAGLPRLLERTFHLALHGNTQPSIERAALLLEPPELVQWRVSDYRRAPQLFELGYRHTLGRAAELHALLR
jgi:NTE family protein